MLPATRETLTILAKRFNQVTQYRWDRIIDFLKLHYLLSQRTDSNFWIDNRDPASVPESLREQLELWRHRAPGDADFTSNCEMFPAASYQYVLFGMGFRMDTRQQPPERLVGEAQRALRAERNAQDEMDQNAAEESGADRQDQGTRAAENLGVTDASGRAVAQ